jgi:hypothetical protein
MKPLSERHADRAQRKADNAAESAHSGNNLNDGIGNAARLIGEATLAINALAPEQRERLMDRMKGGDIDSNGGFRSIAEDDAGKLKMAGIGVIDPAVTPAGEYHAAGQDGVQAAGKLPTASYDPTKGNLNGAAVEAAGGGGGAPTTGWGVASDGYGALTLAELKAGLDARGLAYDKNVKDDQAGKDGLVAILRGADKADAAKSAETGGGEGQGGGNS